MVKVQRLHVLVARRLSHLDKGDDVRMINIEKGRIRAAARRTLTIGKARGVINLQVRHHADAFFVGAADADMNAHAAAQHGEPVDFGERIDEPFSTVLHIGEEARNGKSLLRAAK